MGRLTKIIKRELLREVNKKLLNEQTYGKTYHMPITGGEEERERKTRSTYSSISSTPSNEMNKMYEYAIVPALECNTCWEDCNTVTHYKIDYVVKKGDDVESIANKFTTKTDIKLDEAVPPTEIYTSLSIKNIIEYNDGLKWCDEWDNYDTYVKGTKGSGCRILDIGETLVLYIREEKQQFDCWAVRPLDGGEDNSWRALGNVGDEEWLGIRCNLDAQYPNARPSTEYCKDSDSWDEAFNTLENTWSHLSPPRNNPPAKCAGCNYSSHWRKELIYGAGSLTKWGTLKEQTIPPKPEEYYFITDEDWRNMTDEEREAIINDSLKGTSADKTPPKTSEEKGQGCSSYDCGKGVYWRRKDPWPYEYAEVGIKDTRDGKTVTGVKPQYWDKELQIVFTESQMGHSQVYRGRNRKDSYWVDNSKELEAIRLVCGGDAGCESKLKKQSLEIEDESHFIGNTVDEAMEKVRESKNMQHACSLKFALDSMLAKKNYKKVFEGSTLLEYTFELCDIITPQSVEFLEPVSDLVKWMKPEFDTEVD